MSAREATIMPVPITALYAAILAILVTALAMNVTATRMKLGISLGDGDNSQMSRAIRIHGNAIEYIPLALLLMLIYELNGGVRLALYIAGGVLVVSRLLHAFGLWSSDEPGLGRGAGQIATWLTIVALAILNVVKII
jgi:uncharacterized membrane protein YecN with MAPEG domain